MRVVVVAVDVAVCAFLLVLLRPCHIGDTGVLKVYMGAS